jgi:hypothetical protein
VAKNSQSTTDNGTELNQDSISTGKGRPTPTRREKELARQRPLVSSDRSEARRNARAAMQVERDKQRIGMANGDEKYLPMRDRGPQKKYVRDYVDARFSVGELLIPVMVVVIILTTIQSSEVQVISMLVLYGFFVLAVGDAIFAGFRVSRKLRAKYGEGNVEKVRWYTAMRAFQLRLMRLPKPQVKRGQFPA